uniref:Uncharacterized protein n=1 Tax=Lotus japonicus TaxID=34305 RepID=I3T130_LOTJA|nr:unknown [Lotus japonicus]
MQSFAYQNFALHLSVPKKTMSATIRTEFSKKQNTKNKCSNLLSSRRVAHVASCQT